VNRLLVLLAVFAFLPRAKAENSLVRKTDRPELFIVDSWLSGFIWGVAQADSCKLRSGWKRAGRAAANDVKIWGGLFISDPNRKFFGRCWEHLSRFTYELPQTATGFLYAHFENTVAGNADTIRYRNGAVVLTGRRGLFFDYGGPAVTMGNYICGYENIHADPDNPIFQHEYGHYLQSRAMGIAYFGRIAIPSIRSEHGNYTKNYSCHDYHPAELDANRRAFLYFNRNAENFRDDNSLSGRVSTNRGWDFDRNPLAGAGTPVYRKRDTLWYVDYRKQADIDSIRKLKVSSRWYDYLFPIVSGFYNAYRYNH
jgi:hypothetical protein